MRMDLHTLAYLGLTAVAVLSSVDWLALLPSKQAKSRKGRKLRLFDDKRLLAYCCITLVSLASLSEMIVQGEGPRDFSFPDFSLDGVSSFLVGAVVGSAVTGGKPAEGCTVGYVVDGDTVELICNGQSERGRMMDIDTPELRGKCQKEIRAAQAAKAYLTKIIARARNVEVVQKGKDKYGRRLVWLKLDGKDASAMLLAAGHGRPYDGGKRAGWCPGHS